LALANSKAQHLGNWCRTQVPQFSSISLFSSQVIYMHQQVIHNSDFPAVLCFHQGDLLACFAMMQLWMMLLLSLTLLLSMTMQLWAIKHQRQREQQQNRRGRWHQRQEDEDGTKDKDEDDSTKDKDVATNAKMKKWPQRWRQSLHQR